MWWCTSQCLLDSLPVEVTSQLNSNQQHSFIQWHINQLWLLFFLLFSVNSCCRFFNKPNVSNVKTITLLQLLQSQSQLPLLLLVMMTRKKTKLKLMMMNFYTARLVCTRKHFLSECLAFVFWKYSKIYGTVRPSLCLSVCFTTFITSQ